MPLSAIRSRRRALFVLLIALGLGAMTLVGLVLLDWTVLDNEFLRSENACPPDDPALVERAAGFKLPSSIASLYARCINWQEWRGQIIFDMSPADLDAFLASAEVQTPLASTGKPDLYALFADDADSQRIESVTTPYLYAENRRPDVWQHIVIDTANPSLYTVHILFGRD
jgi:hypothetical protein